MPAPQVTWSPAQCMGQPNIDGITTREIAEAYVNGGDVERMYVLTRDQIICALAFEATPLGHYYPHWDDWYVRWAWPFFSRWGNGPEGWQIPLPPREEPDTVGITAAQRFPKRPAP